MNTDALAAPRSLGQLQGLADALARHGLGPWVRVERLSDHLVGGVCGQTDCRSWVRVSDPAPAWVLAHELAHVVARTNGHGPSWMAAWERLCTVMASAATV